MRNSEKVGNQPTVELSEVEESSERAEDRVGRRNCDSRVGCLK